VHWPGKRYLKKLLTCGFVLTSHPKKLIIGGIAATAMIITAAPAEGAPRPESESAPGLAMPDGSFEQYPGQYPTMEYPGGANLSPARLLTTAVGM
jgi:hypothetical protein